MRTIVLLAAASVTLMACRDERPAPPPPPPPTGGGAGGGVCDARGARSMIGQSFGPGALEAAKRRTGARIGRVVPNGAIVTMEYRADRVNVQLDRGRTITGIRCG